MDAFILSSAASPSQGKELLFENKQWIEIPDSNSGVYSSGKVTFNLDNISNSGGEYFNAKETIVQIPLNLCVEVKNTQAGASTTLFKDAPATQVASRFIASLKNGSYHLIDKINYKLNGNEVIVNDSFENVKIHYKIMTKWSQDDVVKRGDELHFAQDNVDAFDYDAATIGVSNNDIEEKFFTSTLGFQTQSNDGRRERMKKTSRAKGSFTAGMGALMEDTDLDARYMDRVAITENGILTTVNFQIMASFRLGDIHPYFESMPLTKNPSQYLALTLNVNAVHSFNVTNVGAGTVQAITGKFSTTNLTNTTPYQLSPVGAGFGFDLKIATAAQTGTIRSCLAVKQVSTSSFSGSVSHSLNQCLFQACYVRLAPTYNIEYAKEPVKPIVWEETYCQSISNVAANSSVNQLISGAFSNLRKVIILPYLSAAGNDGVTSAIQSCVSSEPATGSPLVCIPAISEMNVRLGINNVYPKNIQYAWENYLHSFQGDNCLHGGLDAGLSSGLISQHEWETAYGWRVVDLSRKPEMQDLPAQQITVQFKNSSLKSMDYLVLVVYEKRMGIDTERGLVVL
jgi:hypothetical protein